MHTDMHVLWVQQLAVLPVIVEDRDMVEENVQSGGLPPGSHTVDPSARSRIGERERPTQARRLFLFLQPSPLLFSLLSFLLPSSF